MTKIIETMKATRGDNAPRATNILIQAGAQFVEDALHDFPDGPVKMTTEVAKLNVIYEVYIGERCIWHRTVTFGHKERFTTGGAAFVETARLQDAVAWAALAVVESVW
jgi:hypothetical protein